MKLTRNLILILVSFPLFFGWPGPSSKEQKPNIILVVIDTLRADHLPFYGYEKNTAPLLADLANQSIIFENAYTTSSFTTPATASIFTSVFPLEHGLTINTYFEKFNQEEKSEILITQIPKTLTTLSEFIKKAGYQTYGISHNINICKNSGFARGFDIFKTFSYENLDHGARHLNHEIQDIWVDHVDRSRPFFFYIHYMDPHTPYHQKHPWYKDTGNKLKNDIAAYDSEISYLDRYIRSLSQLLEWQDNTIVFITADHGEGFLEHGSKGHGDTLFQEVLHVPLMVYYPQKFPQGLRIPANVNTMDIYPTICELLGEIPDKKFRGRSLLKYFKKNSTISNERYMYAHVIPYYNKKQHPPRKSVIYKEWKYIEWEDEKRLYNLTNDPGERSNLNKAHPEISGSLQNKLSRFFISCNPYQNEYISIPHTPDQKYVDQLRALGYLH